MKKLASLLKREFRLFFSNKIMKVLYLGGPVLYAVVFGSVYVKGVLTDLPIVVIDKDNSPLSTRLIDMLDESNVLLVKEIRQEDVDLDKIFMQQAAYAAIVIPYRFEADVIHARHPEVNTYINNANILAAGYASRSITAVMATLNATKVAAAGKTTEAFHLNTFRLFNRNSNYFMYIWPSYLAIILQSIIIVTLALSFSAESSEKGRLAALYRESGHSAGLLAFSKLSIYWLLSAVILGVYLLYFTIFRQDLPSHPVSILVILVPFIITNSLVGMIAGLIFKSQLKSLQFLIVLSLPVYITSGFSWPFDQNEPLAQCFAFVFPFTGFVNGFRTLLIEQGTLADIRYEIMIQMVQMACYAVAAYILLRVKIKRDQAPVLLTV